MKTIQQDNFSTRFIALLNYLEQNQRIKQVGFAEKLGISPGHVTNLKKGKDASDSLIKNIARTFSISELWLKTGEGEMFQEGADQGEPRTKGEVKRGGAATGGERNLHPLTYDSPGEAIARGYVQVPRYEIAASAGGGALVHSEQIVDVMSFKSDYLKVSLGLSPKNLAVISVVGDSMEPYLSEGDLAMVDLGVTSIQNNSVYVLQFGDSLLVKRVQVKLDGEVIVKSDNPLYDPESFRGEAAERLRVVGRMVRRLVR